MKRVLLIAWVLVSSLTCNSQSCGIKGDDTSKKKQFSDSLKNRSAAVISSVDTSVTLSSLLQLGNDINRFSADKYVLIEGYVVLVKYGTGETCNCHSNGKADLDIHIELSLTPKTIGVDSPVMIAEVTRYTKTSLMSYENIKKLQGKKVRISGYLFFDDEHKQNASNTNPTGSFIWRTTCWEVHPVCQIEEVK